MRVVHADETHVFILGFTNPNGVVSLPHVPDTDSVRWRLDDATGTEILDWQDVTTSSEDTTAAVEVANTHHDLGAAEYLTRALTYEWDISGVTYTDTIRYLVAAVAPYTAGPDDVRRILNVGAIDLPSADIELHYNYLTLRAQLSGRFDLAEKMVATDIGTVLKANRLLVLKTAVGLVPGLSIGLYQKDTSGPESVTRFDIDWSALTDRLNNEIDTLSTQLETGEEDYSGLSGIKAGVGRDIFSGP